MPSVAVVLAAGLGTRMKSALPKVLHPIVGRPMLLYVTAALREAGVEEIITVLGHGAEKVEEALAGQATCVYQREQLGTGHAVLQALPKLAEYRQGDCLVVCGDTPLLTGDTLRELRRIHQERRLRRRSSPRYWKIPKATDGFCGLSQRRRQRGPARSWASWRKRMPGQRKD